MTEAVEYTGPVGFGVSVDNVNEALPIGLDLVRTHGIPVVSRGLETLEVPGPVTTVYENPMRRVLFDEERDANPFFHLIESLWILAGSRSVWLPRLFLGRIVDYSDNGNDFHGAYGHRLRSMAGFDQLTHVVDLLRAKPDTRQAVLSIWDPRADLGVATKDVPCNDMIMLRLAQGRLNMTVCCRSNDVIYGAYGANAVQFSMLQEWIASMVGAEVGWYAQMSNSYHVYTDNPFWKKFQAGQHDSGHVYNAYMEPEMLPYSIAVDQAEAEQLAVDAMRLNHRAEKASQATITGGIDALFGNGDTSQLSGTFGYQSAFFANVVMPVIAGYSHYKAKRYEDALDVLSNCQAPDWSKACKEWVFRRKTASEIQAGAAA